MYGNDDNWYRLQSYERGGYDPYRERLDDFADLPSKIALPSDEIEQAKVDAVKQCRDEQFNAIYEQWVTKW